MVWDEFYGSNAVGEVSKSVSIITSELQFGNFMDEFPEFLLPPYKAAVPAELRVKIEEAIFWIVELLIEI